MNGLAHLLTDVEIEVIQGWCQGLSNPEIAQVMRDKSEKAVDAIGTRLKLKLRAENPRHACYLWGKHEQPDPR